MSWGDTGLKQKEKRQPVFVVCLGTLQVKGKRRALGEASVAQCVRVDLNMSVLGGGMHYLKN